MASPPVASNLFCILSVSISLFLLSLSSLVIPPKNSGKFASTLGEGSASVKTCLVLPSGKVIVSVVSFSPNKLSTSPISISSTAVASLFTSVSPCFSSTTPGIL